METLNKTLLVTLLDLGQNDVPASVARLSRELGLSRTVVACGLNQLATRGLIRPETMRLTFLGLMRASGARAERQRQSASAAA